MFFGNVITGTIYDGLETADFQGRILVIVAFLNYRTAMERQLPTSFKFDIQPF